MCGIYLIHYRYEFSDNISKISGNGSFAKVYKKRLSDFNTQEVEEHLKEIADAAKTLALENMNKRNKADSISRNYKADCIDIVIDSIELIE